MSLPLPLSSPPRSSALHVEVEVDVDIAIIGAGPVGLALAALLDRHGLTSLVFERRPTLHRDPQAHVINTRTMEILRELGLSAAVQALAAPPMLMRSITWCESLAGREIGRISLQGDDSSSLPARLAQSPTAIANLAQNRLEPLLLDLVRRAARSEVRFDSEVVAVEEEADSVVVRVRRAFGEQSIRAAYVVACDGAGSRTRQGLGIEMTGPASLQKFLSIYFEADLRRWIGDRPGPLYWIAGARSRGPIIGFDLDRTWAMMVPYADPHSIDDFPPPILQRIVADAIGDPNADFRITSVGNWNMSAQVADRYRSGRVFLAGDAAHRFPPSGGLGMNTGIQDAHNLAWKLAAVHKEEAGLELLHTYETERRSVAQDNCDQSVRNAMRMMEVDMVLGVSTMMSVDPGPLARDEKLVIDYGMDGDGEEAVEKRRAVKAVIQAQAEHFDFAGLDLGFRYEEGAVVPDGTEAPPHDVRVYTPSARPGSRLPHVWLSHLGRRTSTLDIAEPGRFTLMTGTSGTAWIEATHQIVRRFRMNIAAIVVADPASPATPGAFIDTDGAWACVRGTDDDGALLVRPDGHVAWRSPGGAADRQAAALALCAALAGILGRPFADLAQAKRA